MKKYTVAIIGLGRIGYLLGKDKKREQPASHSSAFAKNKRTVITSGCDIDQKKVLLWKKDFPHAKTYTDYKKLLSEENPDIIVIAVNEKMHVNTALDAIAHKPKLVVLEKPVAPNMRLADKILKFSKIKKIPVLVNHERRFSKDYILLKNILSEKKIGRIKSVNACLWSNVFVWNKESADSAQGMLLRDATHLIDIIFFLFGTKSGEPKIDRIFFNGKNEISELFFHTIINNKIMVSFEISGEREYFGFELDIKGSLGRAVIGNGYFKVYTKKESPYYENFYSLVRDNKIKKPSKTEFFYNMTKHCVDFLDKKENLKSSIEDGVKTLDFIYKVIKQI